MSGQIVLWIEILLLCLVVLVPAGYAAWPYARDASARRGSHTQREPALALHRAQLLELERDRAGGLIAPSEHAGARLEVERRLLRAAALPDEPDISMPRVRPGRSGLFALAAIPVVALALYLLGGQPGLPAQPLALRMAQADARSQEDAALVDTLRQGLARLDPASPEARQGFILLGQAEASRGDWGAAAAAWRVALTHGFDSTIAVQAAEAQARADGRVSPASAALFRRALDTAPADVPWRQLAEQRLAQSEHQ